MIIMQGPQQPTMPGHEIAAVNISGEDLVQLCAIDELNIHLT